MDIWRLVSLHLVSMHEPKEIVVWRRDVRRVWRAWKHFPIKPFKVRFHHFRDMGSSVVLLKNNSVVPFRAFRPYFLYHSVQSYQLSSVTFACRGFSRFHQFIINNTLLVPPYAQHCLGSMVDRNLHFWIVETNFQQCELLEYGNRVPIQVNNDIRPLIPLNESRKA